MTFIIKDKNIFYFNTLFFFSNFVSNFYTKMLTKSSKYGIRAVLYLASNTNCKRCGFKEIANALNIPAPFLAKTLQELVRNDIISSIKGPNGGFFLSDKDKQNSILDVVNCIDGIEKFDECFLGHPDCNDINPCAVHHIYAPFKTELLHTLRAKNISDFSKEIMKNPNSKLYKIINS